MFAKFPAYDLQAYDRQYTLSVAKGELSVSLKQKADPKRDDSKFGFWLTLHPQIRPKYAIGTIACSLPIYAMQTSHLLVTLSTESPASLHLQTRNIKSLTSKAWGFVISAFTPYANCSVSGSSKRWSSITTASHQTELLNCSLFCQRIL